MIIDSGNLTILDTTFSAAFSDGFGQAPADHMPLTMEVPSSSRDQEYGWLGQAPGMREWVGERVYRGIQEHGYSIRNKKYESSIQVPRDKIEDDEYGVYSPMFNELGRSAAAHPCELVFGALKAGFETSCFDGQYFFDTDHPIEGGVASNDGGGNGTAWFLLDCSRMVKPIIFQRRRDYALRAKMDLDDEEVWEREVYRWGVDARCNVGYGLWQLAYGSKQTLNKANYKAAREAMMGFEGDRGRPMGIMPTHLVVPTTLEGEAP